MLESAWLDRVMGAAKLHRWMAYHEHDSRKVTLAGFPDLVLIRPPRLIFAELKKEDGRLSASQKEVLAALSDVSTIEVYVWRPSDWQEVLAILDRRRVEPPQPSGGLLVPRPGG